MSENSTNKELVLVIDDEPIMRKIAVKVLNECDFNVLAAEDGEQGIEFFQLHHEEIVLVVLDMVLPKKSGKEVYIEMKKIKPDVKVLLNSGFRDDDRVKEVMQLGIKHFIEKPYSFEQLAQAVKNAIKD